MVRELKSIFFELKKIYNAQVERTETAACLDYT